MSNTLAFSFEGTSLTILGDMLNPLFIAKQICEALGFGNFRQALATHCDPEDVCKVEIQTNGGKQLVNCVNESGLYALIFGSKLPKAKQFKRWVTNEVLPAIRKQGYYQVTSNTLTPAQQHQIQIAVAARAQKTAHNYQTIYRALKNRFQVARYDQIPQSKFQDALKFIQCVDLAVPDSCSSRASTGQIFYYDARVLTEHELRALANLIYLRELGKPTFAQVYKGLRDLNSKLAPRFYSLIAEGDFPAAALKNVLSRNKLDFTKPIR